MLVQLSRRSNCVKQSYIVKERWCLLSSFPVQFFSTTTPRSFPRLHSPHAKWIDSISGNEETGKTIRLSKRMSELDLCSRREADRLILDGRVLVDGERVEIGAKVIENLIADRIEICSQTDEDSSTFLGKCAENTPVLSTVVLNKPVGFVSGQAEHGHPPAIRLLTSASMWQDDATSSIAFQQPESWNGFAPAGRLDLDSTGLLVFSSSGVIAKKLIASNSNVEKEYIVYVDPAVQPSRRELACDSNFQLPTTTLDLSPLLDGGRVLLEDEKGRRAPLKPCVEARWIRSGEILRIVLTEGRKHHIRRACRELLGWHVKHLQRVRIGPIHLDNLPEGCWRPIRQEELEKLLV